MLPVVTFGFKGFHDTGEASFMFLARGLTSTDFTFAAPAIGCCDSLFELNGANTGTEAPAFAPYFGSRNREFSLAKSTRQRNGLGKGTTSRRAISYEGLHGWEGIELLLAPSAFDFIVNAQWMFIDLINKQINPRGCIALENRAVNLLYLTIVFPNDTRPSIEKGLYAVVDIGAVPVPPVNKYPQPEMAIWITEQLPVMVFYLIAYSVSISLVFGLIIHAMWPNPWADIRNNFSFKSHAENNAGSTEADWPPEKLCQALSLNLVSHIIILRNVVCSVKRWLGDDARICFLTALKLYAPEAKTVMELWQEEEAAKAGAKGTIQKEPLGEAQGGASGAKDGV